jgi:hypothetical protein
MIHIFRIFLSISLLQTHKQSRLQLLEETTHEVCEFHHLLYLDVPNIGNPKGIDVFQLAGINGKA